MARRNRFALLIDSDNVSAKYITAIMNELTGRHGDVTYRRIYGDWTSTQMSTWKDELANHSLTPMQQFQNTKGKNATDSFLIIDAMDILYEGKVDGFCIVSSDSDFTRLASRLRDAGMSVVGMGEKKTPRSFRSACTVFTALELLLESESEPSDEESSDTTPTTDTDNEVSKGDIAGMITDIVNENSGQGTETTLAEIGNRLVSVYPDFDVRTFGYSQLSKFLESFDNLELERNESLVLVKLKDSAAQADEAAAFIRDMVDGAGKEGCDLSAIGNALTGRFTHFSVKDYGYSKLSKFIRSIPGVIVDEERAYPDE